MNFYYEFVNAITTQIKIILFSHILLERVYNFCIRYLEAIKKYIQL